MAPTLLDRLCFCFDVFGVRWSDSVAAALALRRVGIVRRLAEWLGVGGGAWQWNWGRGPSNACSTFLPVALGYKRATNLPPTLYFVHLADLGMYYRVLEYVAHCGCCVLFILFGFLFVCLFVCLSVCLFVCLFAYFACCACTYIYVVLAYYICLHLCM